MRVSWQIMVARLTFFVTPDARTSATFWRDTLNEEPETAAFQRATLTRTESGPFSDGRLTLITQPMRIDWVHEAALTDDPRTLGTFPGAADPIISLCGRLQASGLFAHTFRIALGFVLISPVSDRQAGYRALEEFIEGVPQAADAVDFQYQVNRPRLSRAIEGLHVNRLSKWSVGTYRILAVTLGSTPNPMMTPREHHLRLELDINTDADFQGVLPEEQILDVVNDLFIGAQEICSHGNRF